ncbi:hypothetical protein VC625_04610 [Citrobacter freundii]|uniref:hypothetical protein n=1 Tax=Citrobacter freundii TaxID=546 RepID=UPI000FFE1C43|nr:hypothetical protein [Citrobacter freundii]MBJ8786218.1 hypothetical protein [Citrobacter freundii]MDV0654193.1 hypothetical protein [Citrobacter freundii]MDV0719962.1 hypothetical protein [Citrobacter freundii]MEB0614743.1 hypothetical protein [Citrobacter freundii]MEB0689893.1 hypothetical protein [Citrobacter freundii]
MNNFEWSLATYLFPVSAAQANTCNPDSFFAWAKAMTFIPTVLVSAAPSRDISPTLYGAALDGWLELAAVNGLELISQLRLFISG